MEKFIGKLKSQPIEVLLAGSVVLFCLFISAVYRLGVLVGTIMASL